jgi:hypothetical protein
VCGTIEVKVHDVKHCLIAGFLMNVQSALALVPVSFATYSGPMTSRA